jgi:hypothetical protein
MVEAARRVNSYNAPAFPLLNAASPARSGTAEGPFSGSRCRAALFSLPLRACGRGSRAGTEVAQTTPHDSAVFFPRLRMPPTGRSGAAAALKGPDRKF